MADSSTDRRTLLGAAGMGIIALIPAVRSSPAFGAPRPATTRSAAEWRKRLGPERYFILRQGGTERPYSSGLNREKRRGTFTCAGCDLPLFSSATKFESGTGWPSFFRSLPNAVATRVDKSDGMIRTEAVCRRCVSHLGHVFKDGPKPTGLRYCINGLALKFRPA